MAKNVEQSKLMAQLKAKSAGAWKRARQVEPKARGQGGFPPNIKNMIGKITAYKFDKTQAQNGKGGDPYFSLSATVIEPPEYAGRRAAFNWFLNESEWATLEQNLEQFANDLGLIAAGTTNYQDGLPADVADAPAFLQELVDNEVYIIFHSGGPRKNDKAPNLFIDGIAEGYTEGYEGGAGGEAGDEQPDGTEEADSGEGEAEEVGDAEEGEVEEAVESADEEAEADEVPVWEVGDQFSVGLGKAAPANCEITKVLDDDKYTVTMLAGPSKGKKFNVKGESLQTYIEEKPAKKPAPSKKPAGKTGKKK
jgi:hypothetical protein